MPQPLPPDAQALPPPHPGDSPPAAAVPCHAAVALTAGGTVAHIRRNGQRCALRITRQGRLILTT